MQQHAAARSAISHEALNARCKLLHRRLPPCDFRALQGPACQTRTWLTLWLADRSAEPMVTFTGSDKNSDASFWMAGGLRCTDNQWCVDAQILQQIWVRLSCVCGTVSCGCAWCQGSAQQGGELERIICGQMVRQTMSGPLTAGPPASF